MKLVFLDSDKHKHLLQINTMVLMGMVKHSQSFQNSKLAMSLQYLKKEVRDELYFWHIDKHQSFLQVDFNTLDIKSSYKVILPLLLDMIKHSESTQSNSFAISLQYPKKKVGMEFIFSMLINIKVSTSWDYCFWRKWPDMSKVPKIES